MTKKQKQNHLKSDKNQKNLEIIDITSSKRKISKKQLPPNIRIATGSQANHRNSEKPKRRGTGRPNTVWTDHDRKKYFAYFVKRLIQDPRDEITWQNWKRVNVFTQIAHFIEKEKILPGDEHDEIFQQSTDEKSLKINHEICQTINLTSEKKPITSNQVKSFDQRIKNQCKFNHPGKSLIERIVERLVDEFVLEKGDQQIYKLLTIFGDKINTQNEYMKFMRETLSDPDPFSGIKELQEQLKGEQERKHNKMNPFIQ